MASSGIGFVSSEPMVLGSPPSPRSSLNPAGGHVQHHLPAYLMGDSFHAHRSSPAAGPSTSPSTSLTSPVVQRSMSSGGSSSLQSPRLPGPVPLGQVSSGAASSIAGRRVGPPTTGLWSTPAPAQPPPSRYLAFSEPPRHSTPTSGLHHHPVPGAPPGPPVQDNLAPGYVSSPFGASLGQTPGRMGSLAPAGVFSPAQTDPFFTQGESLHYEDVLDDSWVTVFGYPQGAANTILTHFSQLGVIEKHVIVNEGNWMHLKYQTKLQAKKALSKNGRVFNGKVMVGVQPCIDKKVMECQSMPPPAAVSTVHQSTPAANSLVDHSLNASARVNSSMRSLAQPRAFNTTLDKSVQDNQNKNGILSKAIDYMFGWS